MQGYWFVLVLKITVQIAPTAISEKIKQPNVLGYI